MCKKGKNEIFNNHEFAKYNYFSDPYFDYKQTTIVIDSVPIIKVDKSIAHGDINNWNFRSVLANLKESE